MSKEDYKEREGDVVINLDGGRGFLLNKIDGKRYFLEVHREIIKSKPTGEYYNFAYDENNKGISELRDFVKKEIDSYFPKVEKFMNENKKVQSIKLEIRVKK